MSDDRTRGGSNSRYYCYILECEDGSYYTGWTTDPERRLRQHSSGRGARYTRAHPPARLAFVEPQPDRASAMRRELALKRMSRDRKQALIENPPVSPEPRARRKSARRGKADR